MNTFIKDLLHILHLLKENLHFTVSLFCSVFKSINFSGSFILQIIMTDSYL